MDTSSLSTLQDAEKQVKLALSRREQFTGQVIRLIIHVVTSHDLNMVPQLSMLMHVGDGSQSFKWLSLAVATRLRQQTTQKTGSVRSRDHHELCGFFLPASINTSKTAQLVLSEMFSQTVWPTERIRDHVADGDELFVSIATKCAWTEACSIDYSIWQDAAYHGNNAAASGRLHKYSVKRETDARLKQNLSKWRAAAWDSGVALRLQAVIGALPSQPAPPPPTVFGMASSPDRTPHPVMQLADALFENHDKPPEPSPHKMPAGATQWLAGGDMVSMFEKDWSKMQSLGLLPPKDREALRVILYRSYGAIRDVFRFYSNVMNAAVAVRTTLSSKLSGLVASENTAIESAFKMSRIELDLFLKDCRLLNSTTLPYLSPANIVHLIVSGELKRLAASIMMAEPAGRAAPGRRESVRGTASSTMTGPRFVGVATSPQARRAILQLKPKLRIPTDADDDSGGLASPAGFSMLGAAGKSVLSPKAGAPATKPPAALAGFRPAARASVPDAKAAAEALITDEMDRAGFLDALVLLAAGFWEASKGDNRIAGRRRSSAGLAEGSPTPAGPPSLAAMKIPPARAHMVTHLITTYVLPRSKHVQGTVGIRRDMGTKKVAQIILNEMPLLKFAYQKFCNVGAGEDAAMDIGGWRKMLADCGLYQRTKVESHDTKGDALSQQAGLDNMKGKRLTERDLVLAFILSQSEEETSTGIEDSEMDSLTSAVASGSKALSTVAQGVSAEHNALAEMSFSEWVEGLARVALVKWDDPTMGLAEKIARVIDAVAIRLATDPTSGWRPGILDVVRTAQHHKKA